MVTGSSGAVGTAISRELHAAGHHVRGWDLRPGVWTAHRGDVREAALRRRLLDGADAVVHTAALHAPHVGNAAEDEFHAVNVSATAALLRAARTRGVRRFVHTSSTSVYGHALVPHGRAVWVDEQLPPRPRDVYDETKRAAEQLVGAAHGSDLSTVVLRIARCFPEPAAAAAAHRLHRGVALDDVARAHRLAVQHTDVGGVFVIAGPLLFHRSDAAALRHDAASVLAERAPREVAVFRRQGWPLPDRLDRVYDSTAAARHLGYHPVHGVRSLAEE
ncbi:NAD(P)-dependent oxidoreductase [Salinifilum aidingensis]